MGGTFGKVSGKSKIEAYLKYCEIAESDMWGTRTPNPHNKKGCKAAMEWDANAEELVLHYHLHT